MLGNRSDVVTVANVLYVLIMKVPIRFCGEYCIIRTLR